MQKEEEFYQTISVLPQDAVLTRFQTTLQGLDPHSAARRLHQDGQNIIADAQTASFLRLLVSKFVNPLILLLLIIAIISLVLDQKVSAIFIGLMIIISIGMDVYQEYKSDKTTKALNSLIANTITVTRGHSVEQVDVRELVVGDLVHLRMGDIIPADMYLIAAENFQVNPAALTGESYPVSKTTVTQTEKGNHDHALNTAHTPTTALQNIVFAGTTVITGTASGIVIATGARTQFGTIAAHTTERKEKTSFDKGIEQFTMLMIKCIVILTLAIFAVIMLIKRGSFTDALLFSLAVAVGLTPEMLPTMVAINLSNGARQMSKREVIVKRLDSIQNFGAMDVLCTDKTGTLTMDDIVLQQHIDINGAQNKEVMRLALLNSHLQSGIRSVLDLAVIKHNEQHDKINLEGYAKCAEIPFDFERKILSVAVVEKSISIDARTSRHKKASTRNDIILISKGAPEEILARCTTYYSGTGKGAKTKKLTGAKLKEAQALYEKYSAQGFRVLAIATKNMSAKAARASANLQLSVNDENKLAFHGFATFLDPAKPRTKQVLASLHQRGIAVKILTGDNEIITRKICQDVGLTGVRVITQKQLAGLSAEKLAQIVDKYDAFTRLSPLDKELIVKALQKNGHVVGFLGDGINDAPALKAADVGISVNNAVPIAKETADIILLQKDLSALEEGVIEGRKTFGNITKYVKMGSSSNFGNMFSMATATLILPFLPMLPIQILLNNFMYDLSNTLLPTDNVDAEYMERPKPWNVSFIRDFMFYIGPISSIFDLITFAALWFIFGGNLQTPGSIALFHTGWFIESLCTQTLIVYIIRTNKIPFVQSRPSAPLVLSTLLIIVAAIAIIFSPLAAYFAFVQLPISFFALLIAELIAYVLLVHIVKTWLVRRNPSI